MHEPTLRSSGKQGPLMNDGACMTHLFQTARISLDTIDQHGALLKNLLQKRKAIFVDQLGWDVPNASGMEADQYDIPFSHWVAVHDQGEVIAGVRLTPTTARCGIYTYMLKDAHEGRLQGLPRDLLYLTPPVSSKVWEASRVFICDHLSADQRNTVRAGLLSSMIASARSPNADRLICLLPGWWPRLADLGLTVRAAGPMVDISGPHQAVEISIT